MASPASRRAHVAALAKEGKMIRPGWPGRFAGQDAMIGLAAPTDMQGMDGVEFAQVVQP